MNKVRITGIAMVLTGILIGFYFTRVDLHLFSGMLIGIGTGWVITGRLIVNSKMRKSRVRS